MAYIYKSVLKEDTDSYKKGTVYIGQSLNKDKYYRGSGKLITAISKKYGGGIFEKTIIVQGDFNRSLLNDLERHYIRLYASNIVGLNLDEGGSFPTKHHWKEVSQYSGDTGKYVNTFPSLRAANRAIGKCNGSVHEAVRDRIKCGGFYWSYDKAERIDLPSSGTYNQLGVHLYDLGGNYEVSFNSQTETASYIGVCTAAIRTAIDKSNRKCGKYQLRTTKVESCSPFPKKKGELPIYSATLDGKYLCKYENIKQAVALTGIPIYSIRFCINGTGDSAGGFQFSFEKDKWADLTAPRMSVMSKGNFLLEKGEESVKLNSMQSVAEFFGLKQPHENLRRVLLSQGTWRGYKISFLGKNG
jgi:hypothetical protein